MAASSRKTLELAFAIMGKISSTFKTATGEAQAELKKTAEEAEKLKKISEAIKMRDFEDAFKGLDKSTAAVSKSWKGLTGSITTTAKQAALITGTLTAATYGTATAAGVAGDKYFKASQKIGITTEAFSALSYAANMSGVEGEALASSLAKLNKALVDVQGGGKETTAAFKAMGINVKDASGNLKSTDAVLLEVAKNFAKNKDGAQKTALAMQLFGKSGAELIPFLNAGESGISALMQKAQELGLTFDDLAGKNSEDFMDSLADIKNAGQGLINTIGKQLHPILTTINNDIVAWIASNQEWLKSNVADAVASFTEYLPTLRENIRAVVIWIKETATRINEIVQNFGGWGKAIKYFIATWALMRAAVVTFNVIAVTRNVAGLGLAIGKLAVAAGKLGPITAMSKQFPILMCLLKAVKDLTIGVLYAFKGMIGLLPKLFPVLSGLGSFLGFVGKMLGLVTVQVFKFAAALLANPIGLIILAVAALGTAIYVLYKRWDDFVGWWKGACAAVKTAFDEGFISGVLELFKQFNPAALFIKAINAIIEYFTGVSLLDEGAKLMKSFIDGLMAALGSAKDLVKNKILSLLPDVASIFSSNAAAVSGDAMARSAGHSGRAEGGLITRPELSWIGEKGPEMIIPLDGSKRAMGLLSDAARRLGAVPGATKPQAPLGDGLARAVAPSAESNNFKPGGNNASFVFNVTVNASGGADVAGLEAAMNEVLQRIKGKMSGWLDEMNHNRARTAMW